MHPPKHPMWTIQCMQQDGRILVQNLRRIDASSDGVIPEGVRSRGEYYFRVHYH